MTVSARFQGAGLDMADGGIDRGTEVRRMLDQYFDTADIRPQVVAEFADSALMKICGQAGLGLFPGPARRAGTSSR